ncbi:unnamed protein product [Albugo candida]|uniref:RxLR effector protein n=1 Tax=Albugo candida TaxID=65357 RepID=A0A024GK00_9STRA|nr:unnamed protein product [Albugo candida]|eukprot:CCI47092.1 unnamed protein product [Albugo candida]
MKSYLFLVATIIGASLASSNSDVNSEDTMQKQLPLNEDSTAEQDEQLDPEQSRFGGRGGWDGRRGGWDGRRGGWDGRRGGWDGRRGGRHGRW